MKKTFLAAAVLLITLSCAKQNPVISVEGGKIKGVVENGVTVYRGIPFAAPPVGDLRWQAPQPVVPWDGIKVCDTFGPICPQEEFEEGTFYWREFYWMGSPEMSEDCLYLNVWAPADARGKSLPVAMWIHGGAYDHGYGYEVTMDGTEWAKRGVIMVTINYRVGIFGFLSHPELSAAQGGVSGNYGLMDQIKALEWVKDNISAFGGDPGNITILGQSAGAGSVKNLCASPLSKGLIAKAIIQSGGGLAPQDGLRTPAVQVNPDSTGKRIMDQAGLTSISAMRAASQDELLAALAEYKKDNRVRLAPHKDGHVLTQSFDEAVYGNTVADIPYMIGCTTRDMAGMRSNAIDNFAEVRSSLSDKPVYEYYFQRDLPAEDDDKYPEMDGAFHSADLWYMFGTLKKSWRPFTEADSALSEKMLDAWTGFAKSGNPGWAPSVKGAVYKEVLDITPTR